MQGGGFTSKVTACDFVTVKLFVAYTMLQVALSNGCKTTNMGMVLVEDIKQQG